MKNLLKMFYILLNIVVIVGFLAFLYFNHSAQISYTCPIMQKVYTIPFYLFIIAIFIFAYAAGLAMSSLLHFSLFEKCNAYQKRSENIAISNEGDKAKIATLEAKIKTLEVALESALKKQ